MTLLSLENLSVTRHGQRVVDDISMSVGAGEVLGLVGPNGAGKTTLMRAALGLLPHQGRSSLAALPPAVRARHAAWLPQTREIAWPVTVDTLVALGRSPHAPTPDDAPAVTRALRRTDLLSYRQRIATRLSGGERARVLLARALAQETPLLMADEPIAGLDPAHQIATMEVFNTLAAGGQSVVVSLHDLGLAARFCTRMVMLDHGRMVAHGTPEAVLSDRRIADVFGITVFRAETAGGLVLQPMARAGDGR